MADPLLIPWDRQLFGLCLLFGWLNSCAHILRPDAMLYSNWVARPRIEPRLWIVLLLSAVWLALMQAFVFQVAELATGLAVLLGLGGMIRWEISLWPGDTVTRLGKYSPGGTALTGYLLGLALAPWFSSASPEVVGWEMGCGFIAAAWVWAGVHKWRKSGVAWLASGTTGLLLAERAFVGPAPARAVRRMLSASPRVCVAVGAFGLVMELAGGLFVIPPARWPVAILFDGMLIGIWLTLGYLEIEWMLVMLALAWCAGG